MSGLNISIFYVFHTIFSREQKCMGLIFKYIIFMIPISADKKWTPIIHFDVTGKNKWVLVTFSNTEHNKCDIFDITFL